MGITRRENKDTLRLRGGLASHQELQSESWEEEELRSPQTLRGGGLQGAGRREEVMVNAPVYLHLLMLPPLVLDEFQRDETLSSSFTA